MRITEEERLFRMQKIVRIAFQLFCERGIEHVSLVDIAKAANVGETTIYRYFKNKARLVVSTMEVLWGEIGDILNNQADSTEGYAELTGFEQLKVRLHSYKKLYLVYKDYVLFSYDAKMFLLRHQVKMTIRQYDGLIGAIKAPCIKALEKGKEDGSINVAADSEDLFYAIWGTIRGYVVKVVVYGELYGKESPWEKRYDLMEQGILCALSAGWKL